MKDSQCIFCNLDKELIAENELAIAFKMVSL